MRYREFLDKDAKAMDDMMRRAAKKGRLDDTGNGHYITRSDSKKLKNVEFPGVAGDKVIDFDKGAEKLILLPKDTAGETSEEISNNPIPKATPKDKEDLQRKSGSPKGAKDEVQDFLMWVGYNGYPKIENFIAEAEELGVSKRISRLPKGLVSGKSRVFLAHDEGIQGDAVIFGYFTVEAAEVILEDIQDLPLEWKGKVRPVALREAYLEPVRGGGHREIEGALYLVCNTMNKRNCKGDSFQAGGMAVFKEYRDYNQLVSEKGKRFRSYRKIDGDLIIDSDLTKTSPCERAIRTIDIPEDELPPAKSPWTPRERDELAKLVDKHGKLYPAFKEFSRQTNRSLRSVEYQWFKPAKDAEATDEVGAILKEEASEQCLASTQAE